MEFKAETKLEYRDFLSWIKVHAKTSRRKLNTVLNVLTAVALALIIAGAAILICLDAMDTDVVIMLVGAGVCFGVILMRDRINARSSQKLYVRSIGTVYITANDEAIFAKNLKSEEKYFYSGLTAIYTNGDTYYLLLDKNHAIILPKRSFTSGDPEGFAAFLTEKTGLAVEYIKC